MTSTTKNVKFFYKKNELYIKYLFINKRRIIIQKHEH